MSTLTINNVLVSEGNSGTTDARFTVFLSEATAQEVTVDYFTSDGTAAAGFDYERRSGKLTFAPGDTSKTITVPVIGDGIDEIDESFTVTLHNATNATISDSQGTGTIRDDDSSTTPSITINNILVSEGDTGTTNARFTVSLSQASSSTVTVDFFTSDVTASSTTDYIAQNGTLTFNAGETSKSIDVPVRGDGIDEVDETFIVQLTSATNATINDSRGEGTIRDDDSSATPTLTINNATVREGNSGTVDAVFTVSLSEASGQTVRVNYSTTDGSADGTADFVRQSGTLTFEPGDTSKTIAVRVHGDTIDETDESFTLTLTNPVNTTIADGQGLGTILDDDPATVLTASISDVTVTEAETTVNATFTVVLSSSSSDTVAVQFRTSDRTANAPSDYQSTSGTLTFAPGETVKTITVPIAGDSISEPTETFVVDLSNPINVTIADSQGTGTIQDNDTNPGVSISDVSIVEGDSGETATALFTVTVSGESSQAITIDFATSDGSATAPGDYTTTSGRLVINPGETTATIGVPIQGDDTDEPDESFVVTLTAVSNAQISDSQGIGTILDDDGGTDPGTGNPTVTIDDVTVIEGDSGSSNAVFTVRLSAIGNSTVTVTYSTSDGTAEAGTDYFGQSGTLTFQPGESAKTVSVPVVGDTVDEADETFFVNLTGVSNAAIGDNRGLGTIRDNDDTGGGPGGEMPTISINDVTTTEGDSSTTQLVFTIRLSAASSSTVTVDIATADGSAQTPADYDSRGGRLTFLPGETAKTLSVPIRGDMDDEPNENFFANLSNATNATIADSQGVGTIVDDDPAEPPPFSISISDARITEGNSGSSEMLFRVVLSTVTSQPVTVDFTTADGSAGAGSDYVARLGTVTFAPGETIEMIAITILGDATAESDESFFVNLSNATNASIADGQGTGTIADDDSGGAGPTISINDVTLVEGDSGTTHAVLTVSLSRDSSETVTVDFSTANGSARAPGDYQPASGTINFAPGVRSQTISVPIHGDTSLEGNEQLFVNLSNAANASVADAQGVVTIINDDSTQPVGSCTVTNSRGTLRIIGDNANNLIQVSDDGSGTIIVSSDCGVNETYSGISRIHIITGAGADTVDYEFTGNPATARWITMDLGDGDDSASFTASGVAISQNLQIRINGGAGADTIAAAIDAVIERSRTPLGLYLDGGLDSDEVESNVRLRGGSAFGAIRVIGGDGDDELTLNLDAPRSVSRRLKAQIDGGNGADICTSTGPTKMKRC